MKKIYAVKSDRVYFKKRLVIFNVNVELIEGNFDSFFIKRALNRLENIIFISSAKRISKRMRG